MRLSPWFLLFSSAVISSPATVNELDVLYDGTVVEDEFEYAEQFPTVEETAATRCCTDADPSHLLVVSTMDGKMQALDVENGGRIVWQSDLDGAGLLGGNLGKMEPLTAEGDRFVLVPSLDGSLYMFSMEQRVLEPIPLSTDMFLHSVRIGKEAVAGGKSISTTGVDPATGKIRYHCTSAQCEQAESNGEKPMSTLVFRRVSHNIRAVDALNGSEKWNLSVSEYDATLVRQKTSIHDRAHTNNNIRFIISPPKGTITAVDLNGRTRWTTSLGVHIARSWHLDGFDLNEVSLFDSNIHSINNLHMDERALARPESLFYLGTIENDPFILCSPNLRKEMDRISKQIDSVDEKSRKVDHNTKALVKAGGETYQVAEGILDEVLGRAFKQSISRLKERRSVREIAGPEYNPPDEMQIALPAPDDLNTGTLNSCEVPDEGVLMIGEDNIRNAEPTGDSRGDQGWFILRPASSSRTLGFLSPPAQCTAHFVKKTFRLENEVNPLWRLLAIFLLFVTGVIGMFNFAKMRKRWREARNIVDGVANRDETSEGRLNPVSFSDPLPITELSQAAPVRKVKSDDVLSPPIEVRNEQEVEAISRKRNMSSRTGSDHSSSDHFESTFLRNFEPVRVLGRGGFGVVFEATNRLDQCHYAVKRIAVGNNEKAIDRVLREVRAMAMLDHPGIIRYCTTWLERPPEGWQKDTDRDMLAQIAARKNTGLEDVIESSESLQESIREKTEEEGSSLGIAVPPDRSIAEESWADDADGDENLKASSTSSSTSDDDDDSEESKENRAIPFKHDEDLSDSVIFDHGSERNSIPRAKSRQSQKSLELSQLDTDMALVTSIDEELLPSRNTVHNVFLYIQMQLCEDKTLYGWLLVNRSMASREEERMKRWMRQLVSAVLYIHDKGLIHRDIKPQNIFVFGDSDIVKIGDLGLVSKGSNEVDSRENESKRLSSSTISSLHTDNVGTRTYMSPEQLASRQYTSKVDVFSLGLIFTELNVPFSTLMERSKVLSNLQCGIQPEELQTRPEAAKFVSWLTNISPEDRPTCRRILDSDFLKERNSCN